MIFKFLYPISFVILNTPSNLFFNSWTILYWNMTIKFNGFAWMNYSLMEWNNFKLVNLVLEKSMVVWVMK